MLFIDNEDSEIFVDDVFRQEPMCSNNDIYISGLQIFECLGDFSLALEASHNFDIKTESEKPLESFVEMLVCEYDKW